jgi:hypothetical protein
MPRKVSLLVITPIVPALVWVPCTDGGEICSRYHLRIRQVPVVAVVAELRDGLVFNEVGHPMNRKLQKISP